MTSVCWLGAPSSTSSSCSCRCLFLLGVLREKNRQTSSGKSRDAAHGPRQAKANPFRRVCQKAMIPEWTTLVTSRHEIQRPNQIANSNICTKYHWGSHFPWLSLRRQRQRHAVCCSFVHAEAEAGGHNYLQLELECFCAKDAETETESKKPKTVDGEVFFCLHNHPTCSSTQGLSNK